jgi:hypothetical protein
MLCFLLTAVLAVGFLGMLSSAEDDIFFTAVNNTLLDLSPETMPVNYNSMIYVPSSVFNSRALDTYSYYSRGTQMVLISDGVHTLYFDMSAGGSYDGEDNAYRYAAIYYNDTAYVPAFFVTDYFGLGYSYIRREGRHIVRLTKGSVLTDEAFFNAASSLMDTRLNQYLSAQETPAPPTTVPSPTPTPAKTPPPTATPGPTPTQPPVGRDRSDVTVRLCFLGLNEDSASILDALEEAGVPACFFASAGEVYTRADLVRRILGSGYGLGLLLQDSPAEEYGEFCLALRQTAMSVSFLAAGAWLSPEEAAEEELGIRLLTGDEVLSGYYDCSARLAAARGSCDLMLSGRFQDTDLLIQLLKEDQYTLEEITEVTKER